MSSHNEQNGCQPSSVPVQQSVALTDPRIRNYPTTPSDTPVEVCRNYVWGICNKHGQCRFRHECTIEEMKSIINFCHNYQNRTGCTLPNCTYLHTTKEEENLFREKGLFPRVLLERHAAMHAAAVSSFVNNNMAPMENAAMYMTPPPPPPITVAAPLPPSVPTVMPPPPPPPPTEATTITPIPSTIYSAPPPSCIQGIRFSQPPPPLPKFDRPPPIVQKSNMKRPIIEEAGPSKLRKADDGKAVENMCEKCMQRELSSDIYLQEIDTLLRQKDLKKKIYKNKLDENDQLKQIVKILLPGESSLPLEEYTDVQPSSLKDVFLAYLLNTNSERSPSPGARSGDILAANIATTSAIATGGLLQSNNGLGRFINGQRMPSVHPSAAVQLSLPPTANPRAAYASTPISAPRPFASAGASTPNTVPLPSPSSFPSYQPSPTPAYPAYHQGVPTPGPVVAPFQPTVPPPPMRLQIPAYNAPGATVAPFLTTPRVAPPPTPAPHVPAVPAPPSPAIPTTAPASSTPAPSLNGHTYAPYMFTGYTSHHYYPPNQ